MDFVGNYDTAYYYAVARNIALGQTNADNVLWHWLGTPASVARPPGDYWSPGWPILLGALMSLVGHTMKDAMYICASLSLALPLLVFWAVWSIRRDMLWAWLAGLVLIPQERDRETNFMPDIALSHQLFLMLGLCLLLRAQREIGRERWRWAIAGFVLTTPLWLRGEGFLVPAAAASATLLDTDVPFAERLGRLRWLLLGSAICLAGFMGYNMWAFGSTVPEPRALTPYLINFGDYYRAASDPGYEAWRAQGADRILARITDVLAGRATRPLQEIPILLLALAALGAFIGGKRLRPDGRTLPFVLVMTFLCVVPAVTAPIPSNNPSRFVQASTPLICVLAALALGRLLAPWRRRRVVIAAASVVFVVGGSVWFWPMQVRDPLSREAWKSWYTPIPSYLEPPGHPPLQPDDLVGTTDPCQFAAVLGVPTLMLPIDGPDAVRGVVARYHPRYFLLPDRSQWWIVAGTARGRAALSGLRVRPIREAADGTWYEIIE